MAAALDDDDNDLNFSDIDSDDDTPAPAQTNRSFIAHKEMKSFLSEEHQSNHSNESDEFEPISPPTEQGNLVSDDTNQTFEPISPSSDPGGDFEAVSPVEKLGNAFENISDEENDQKEDEPEEGKFSPTQESDNELNFDEENSNDSGYHLLSSKKTTSSKPSTSKNVDDIEAPVPSPFSDVEDIDDLPVQDDSLLNDFLVNKSNDKDIEPIDDKNESDTHVEFDIKTIKEVDKDHSRDYLNNMVECKSGLKVKC